MLPGHAAQASARRTSPVRRGAPGTMPRVGRRSIRTTSRTSARRTAPTTSCRPSRRSGSRWWRRFAERAARYGFGLAITPIFEHLEVFQRVGESHRRRPQGDVRLRRQGRPPPRAAARGHRAGRARRSCSTARPPPWKVWYVAPNFRYERPQKGRYRQHWQVGAEVLGVDDPDVDVEVIALAHGFYRDLGLARRHAAAQLDGRRRRPARVRRRCCATYLAATTRDALGDDVPRAGRRRTRCASSTRSAPTGRTSSSARRSSPST